jgi:hypothetical protein
MKNIRIKKFKNLYKISTIKKKKKKEIDIVLLFNINEQIILKTLHIMLIYNYL